eukprot:2303947-Amphidinium_carterae.1
MPRFPPTSSWARSQAVGSSCHRACWRTDLHATTLDSSLPCPTCSWLQLRLPRVTTWNSSALFSTDVQLRRSRIK